MKAPNLTALELVGRFRSLEEWRAWANEHPDIYSLEYAEKAIGKVRISGITDPLTEAILSPEQVLIPHDNYRETIKADRLISRHRALLLELRHIASQGEDYLTSRKSRIYAPEALTDFALYLRDKFPLFIGGEYVEMAEEMGPIHPIQSQNLTSLSFETAGFDLIISNEDLQYESDIDQSLREFARILDKQGVLISTFPFAFGSATGVIKARLNEGQIEYLMKPEYHGNPMKPDDGSLVFEIPGWDLIVRARAAGFEDAYFAFISSAQHGILGKDINGVFVFVAIKGALSEDQSTKRHSTPKPSKSGFDTVAGLIGLPRSGTTVFAAAVGAHPHVKTVFEPWNARKKNIPPTNLGVQQFVDLFDIEHAQEEHLLFVKETATDLVYLEAIDALLSDAEENNYATRLIWIYRDPMHTFLSEVQARKDWWGEPDLEATADTFDRWAERSLTALQKIVAICQKYQTLCVGYESFVLTPADTLEQVMAFLGLSFDESQLEYFRSLNKNEIRGDNNVAKNPQAISNESAIKRAGEAKSMRKAVTKSKYFKKIEAISKAGNNIFNELPQGAEASKQFLSKVNAIIAR